ncbi:hypothetical protein [Flavobacterium sp.]|uniref:hypothetical protein n=1 Tax=Flavobacterium sp. TaxID=239 RepID=UPI002B4B52DC|nr:hypothetical protein [Flavobacterium sp.]HLP65255.1 hypothetical protein [Flavobacterium sp.]
MKIKFLVSMAIFAVTSFSVSAQEVEIKDDKVLLDGKQILKYEKINIFQHSFYSLDDNEILLYKYNDNETKQYSQDDYLVLNFLTEKTKVETKDIMRATSGMGMNSRKNMEKLVGWLLKEKVIDANGVLNPEKVQIFFEKYDQNITERTVRY